MTFVPPLFSKFGKDLKDLLKKSYEYKHELTVNSRPHPGLILESKVSSPDDKNLEGAVKLKYDRPEGTGEMNYSIDGSADIELKATQIYPNLCVTARADTSNGKVGAEYRAPNVSFTAHGLYGWDSRLALTEASVVGDYKGISIGGSGKYNFTESKLEDYNVGMEYTKDKLTATIQTTNRAETAILSIYQQVANRKQGVKNTQVGLKVEGQLTSLDSSVLTVGTQHHLDSAFSVRAKLDTKGVFATVLEHRLDNPALTLSLAAQWNVLKKKSSPDKFGVGFKFDA